MERIVIIGSGGSGKTVLARQLGEALGIPVTYLDALYYDASWNPMPPREFADLQRDLVATPRWIIDGNYASTLPIRLAAADTVIFLDLPPLVCLWNVARRRRRYRGGQHPETGVYDRVTWQFVRYILGYRRAMRPRVRRMIADHAANARVLTFTSPRSVRSHRRVRPIVRE